MIRRWWLLPLTVPLLAVMLCCALAGAPFRVIWWTCEQLLDHLTGGVCWDSWHRPPWARLAMGSWYA